MGSLLLRLTRRKPATGSIHTTLFGLCTLSDAISTMLPLSLRAKALRRKLNTTSAYGDGETKPRTRKSLTAHLPYPPKNETGTTRPGQTKRFPISDGTR